MMPFLLFFFTVDYTPYGRGLPARLFSFYSGDGLRVSAEIFFVGGQSDRKCGPVDAYGFLRLSTLSRRGSVLDRGCWIFCWAGRQMRCLFFPFPAAGRESTRRALLLEETTG